MANSEAVVRKCSIKKVFLEISQNSQENTCARGSFVIKLQARTPFLQIRSGGCFCKLQVNEKKLFHTYSVIHFAFVFSEYIIFSEYMTITSSKETLKVCEHNFFQKI